MIARMDWRHGVRAALLGTAMVAAAFALAPASAPAKKASPKKPACKKGKERAGCRVQGFYKGVVGNQYANVSLNPGAISVGLGARTTCGGQVRDVALALPQLNKQAKVGKTYTFAGSNGDDGNGIATDGSAKITVTSAKKIAVTFHINAHGVTSSVVGTCAPIDVSLTAKPSMSL